jgi:hypothetical protein
MKKKLNQNFIEDKEFFDRIKHILLRRRKKSIECIHQSIDVVTYYLNDAHDFGLASEVVAYALKYMKENPKLDISEAMAMGYEEWLH